MYHQIRTAASTRDFQRGRLLLAAGMALAMLCMIAPALSAQDDLPTATVTAAVLNVRTGPGAGHARTGTVVQGDRLALLGQEGNCAWLQVRTPQEVEGWVSGRYVALEVACTAIGAPAPAVTVPVATPVQVPAAPQPTPEPAASPTQAPGEPGQGCYLFENQLGPNITVTITDQRTGKGETFILANTGDNRLMCFWPGRYTVTADAPPPWNSINFELRPAAGEFEPILFHARP